MKKVNFRIVLSGLMFAVALLFIGSSDAVAQSSSFSENYYTVPQGNFVSPEEADLRLDGELVLLKNLIKQLIPGSNAYKEAVWKHAYIESIQENIAKGTGVAESIVAGLGVFATDVHAGVSRVLKSEFRDQAIELLSA